MLDLARVGPGDHVIDLGTGDGRILLAAARDRGARGLGVDLDPVLIRDAQDAATRAGVADRVTFRTQDLFETPLAEASVVTMFLLPEINLRLRPRLLAELQPGARVVSHAFDMGDWRPDATTRAGGARIYLWVVPARVTGAWTMVSDSRRYRVHLEQAFQRLSGRVVSLRGTYPLHRGVVQGTTVRFTADLPEGVLAFEGRLQGDGMIAGEGWRLTPVSGAASGAGLNGISAP